MRPGGRGSPEARPATRASPRPSSNGLQVEFRRGALAAPCGNGYHRLIVSPDRESARGEPLPAGAPPGTEKGPGEPPRRGPDPVRALLAQGEFDRAATEAIQRHGPGVLRFLRLLLGDEEDAADAHAEWSERLWRGLPGFRWDCSLRTWAFKIAWNVAQNARDDAWRRRRRRLPTGAASALAQEIRSRSPRTVEHRWRGLERLRSRLRAEDRSLLNLRFEQDLSWSEIGEILGASPDALMQRYKRIKDRMSRMAKDEGLLE